MAFLYWGVTFVLVVLPVDLDEDPGVAATHYQQREHIEGDEVKHVVDCLLPSLLETSMGHTLGEVHAFCLDGAEDKQLWKRRWRSTVVNEDIATLPVVFLDCLCQGGPRVFTLWI